VFLRSFGGGTKKHQQTDQWKSAEVPGEEEEEDVDRNEA
jgi:hypothetical protein